MTEENADDLNQGEVAYRRVLGAAGSMVLYRWVITTYIDYTIWPAARKFLFKKNFRYAGYFKKKFKV